MREILQTRAKIAVNIIITENLNLSGVVLRIKELDFWVVYYAEVGDFRDVAPKNRDQGALDCINDRSSIFIDGRHLDALDDHHTKKAALSSRPHPEKNKSWKECFLEVVNCTRSRGIQRLKDRHNADVGLMQNWDCSCLPGWRRRKLTNHCKHRRHATAVRLGTHKEHLHMLREKPCSSQ